MDACPKLRHQHYLKATAMVMLDLRHRGGSCSASIPAKEPLTPVYIGCLFLHRFKWTHEFFPFHPKFNNKASIRICDRSRTVMTNSIFRSLDLYRQRMLADRILGNLIGCIVVLSACWAALLWWMS